MLDTQTAHGRADLLLSLSPSLPLSPFPCSLLCFFCVYKIDSLTTWGGFNIYTHTFLTQRTKNYCFVVVVVVYFSASFSKHKHLLEIEFQPFFTYGVCVCVCESVCLHTYIPPATNYRMVSFNAFCVYIEFFNGIHFIFTSFFVFFFFWEWEQE